MGTVYVTGHRNPDLDSVCSAYGYAGLMNMQDAENTYIPVRCGHLSESVRNILEQLEIEIPVYMRDVYPKVKDVMLTDNYSIDAEDSLTAVAAIYEKNNPSAIPVYNKDEFYGLLTVDDITNWTMRELSKSSKITAIPKVKEIMSVQKERVSSDELFDEARSILQKSDGRGLAVYEDDKYVGFVTRRCFLRFPEYNVILVDHNEPGQSIRGIETANIVGILDHHRLDAIKTKQPIFICAEPLGSTCTIVYQQYIRNNRTPDSVMAKVLLTGILSDTLILKSPTTTGDDVVAAHILASIAKVDVEEYGMSMFSRVGGLKDKDPQAEISADFKAYSENGVKIGIGQCEVTTLNDLRDYSDRYLEALNEIKSMKGLDWAVLMITDVIHEHSALLCTDHRGNRHLPYTSVAKNIFDMPRVMSRKKQLLPEIIHAVGDQ
ncbi:Inorganic pyrophosphatase/exopolyphosphatase [Eubacterium ruminantium]|nr:Inorganic pyrophosphatase/exopolyphosphatase [Eubacterium ruminantium]